MFTTRFRDDVTVISFKENKFVVFIRLIIYFGHMVYYEIYFINTCIALYNNSLNLLKIESDHLWVVLIYDAVRIIIEMVERV